MEHWDTPEYKNWGVGGVSSRTCGSPVRSFALTGWLMAQPIRMCAMCVIENGPIRGWTCPELMPRQYPNV
jgi:hypothetical protein